MSHLCNPLVTAEQLYQRKSANALPAELQDSIRFYTARLTQAAGILLRLPQDITAQANVLLFRYWVVDDLQDHEFSDVSAATIYLTAKISASPRSVRSIANVYKYLLSSPDLPLSKAIPPPDPTTYYLSEGLYERYRDRILNIEGQILNALGFNTHVALPHPLAITYLQTLDVFAANKQKENEVAKRTIEYLNTALLSPQMLYLTNQPNVLAVAAAYLGMRDVAVGVRGPEVEWWEVFDVEREELGFVVVGMGSLEGVARREKERWGERGMITRSAVKDELRVLGVNRNGNGAVEEDEEAEMARIMDAKVDGV